MRQTYPRRLAVAAIGMNEKYVIEPVHVQTSEGPAHPVVKWVRRIYWVLIPMTLGFMVLHNLLDLLAKMRRPRTVTNQDTASWA